MLDTTCIQAEQLEPEALLAQRYRIERQLGTGGSASVYLATDVRLFVPVALKVLHSSLCKDAKQVERFLREAQAMFRVEHPYVVKTYDFVSAEHRLFFTMEYVPGPSLREILSTKRFSLKEAGRIALQLSQALEAIHAQGLVHRDLKPSNILFDQDRSVKLTDFGLARLRRSELTASNLCLGSIAYMAPEVLRGKEITPAADYYALGIVLYELCTGKPPFFERDPVKLAELHLKGTHQLAHVVNANTPLWLSRLIEDLLSPNPGARPGAPAVLQRRIDLEDPESVGPEVMLGFDERSHFTRASEAVRRQRKDRVLSLSAVQLIDEHQGNSEFVAQPRPLVDLLPPWDAPRALEIVPEHSWHEVIAFGIFFASLQVVDGILTTKGIGRFGTEAEGNPVLRELMQHVSPASVLVLVKSFAVFLVVLLTILAQRSPLLRRSMRFLSCLYLFMAILPWVVVLLLC